ncbi:MAG: hypothetical protein NTV94_07955 [Planctomycetota bacterium]|nr:hypothetical protein [Planctomycetota bacterium]
MHRVNVRAETDVPKINRLYVPNVHTFGVPVSFVCVTASKSVKNAPHAGGVQVARSLRVDPDDQNTNRVYVPNVHPFAGCGNLAIPTSGGARGLASPEAMDVQAFGLRKKAPRIG